MSYVDKDFEPVWITPEELADLFRVIERHAGNAASELAETGRVRTDDMIPCILFLGMAFRDVGINSDDAMEMIREYEISKTRDAVMKLLDRWFRKDER